jgi:hypothetical protein
VKYFVGKDKGERLKMSRKGNPEHVSTVFFCRVFFKEREGRSV